MADVSELEVIVKHIEQQLDAYGGRVTVAQDGERCCSIYIYEQPIGRRMWMEIGCVQDGDGNVGSVYLSEETLVILKERIDAAVAHNERVNDEG